MREHAGERLLHTPHTGGGKCEAGWSLSRNAVLPRLRRGRGRGEMKIADTAGLAPPCRLSRVQGRGRETLPHHTAGNHARRQAVGSDRGKRQKFMQVTLSEREINT